MEGPPSFLISVRFLIAFIAFLGYAVQYMQKINMSVGIVCMVNNTALTSLSREAAVGNEHASNLTYEKMTTSSFDMAKRETSPSPTSGEIQCLFKEAKGHKSTLNGEFVWNKKIQGLVLSAYFYGYLTTQIPGGFLSLKFGAKLVLAYSLLVGSILTMAIPLAANISYMALIACRFLIGVAHGLFWPAMSTLWSRWAPPAERSRLAGTANAGAQIGNVVALPLGGFLCIYGFGGGWPSIFYVFGVSGVVWFALWMLLVATSPEEHRFIGQREKDYIVEQTRESLSGKKEPFARAVKLIMTSKSFYGLLIAHTTSNFGTYLILTQLPTYMKEVLKFDIKSNGGLSALPYLAFWLVTCLASVAGDKLIQTNTFSKTVTRKVFNTLGMVVPMGAVLGLAYVTCATPYLGVALLTVGLAFTGCAYGAGYMVNYNDVAGSYAGLALGISNTFATIPGFIAPALVGVLTSHQKQEEWQIVFYITAVVYLVGAISYIVLASGELEPWATKKQADANGAEEEMETLNSNKH